MKRLIIKLDTASVPLGSPAFEKTLATLRRLGFVDRSMPHLEALGRLCGEALAERVHFLATAPGVLSVEEDTQRRNS
jgi:hypothetical protein